MISLDIGDIISNSFRFPFKDLKHLCIVFILFALLLIIPFTTLLSGEAKFLIPLILLVFLLIAPGYFVSVVGAGINNSLEIPVINLGRNIVDTFKLIILHICYIAIPSFLTFVILCFLTGFGVSSQFSGDFHNITIVSQGVNALLGSIQITVIGTIIVQWVFSLLEYIARARLANYHSLKESLKIHKVIKDIRQIGVGKFVGWYLVMNILIAFIGAIFMLLLVIPYVGFIIYLCVVIPILALIHDYSLGLLYSEFSQENDGLDDFDKFEKEIQRLKYGLIN